MRKSEIGSRKSEVQSAHAVIELARRALPLMNATHRDEAEQIIARFERTGNAAAPDEAKQQAAAAFEKNMQPVCGAIVGALQAGDLDALHGLRALLPHLLASVNESPALANVLAQQLGQSLIDGLNAGPEDVL